MIIGSANLTGGGLNNNIEASLKVTLDLHQSADEDLANLIAEQFDALPGKYHADVIRITTATELMDLQGSGRLVDDSIVRPSPLGTTKKNPGDDTVPKIKLLVSPVFYALTKAKPAPKRLVGRAARLKPPTGVSWEKVWASTPLKERDLSIPTGSNTNPTGSINLDKGLLDATVDHRHYFRDSVFNELTWTAAGPTVDEASAVFQLVVGACSSRMWRKQIFSVLPSSYPAT